MWKWLRLQINREPHYLYLKYRVYFLWSLCTSNKMADQPTGGVTSINVDVLRGPRVDRHFNIFSPYAVV